MFVKICGIRNEGDFADTVACGVDAVGVNFWPGSKRYLDPAEARWLCHWAGKALRVGVFVNQSRGAIGALLDGGFIDAVQLHGDEAPGEERFWKERGVMVIRALALRAAPVSGALEEHEADWLLLDTWKPQGFGGHGETFPWEWARQARRILPDRKFLLAGGLHPGNVAKAVREVRPDGVDVASGVESSPGVKDREKVEAFIRNAREAVS